jgi:UDP-glucose 4-epimerase
MLTHRFSSPTKPKRVVVIGAAGFVGGAVVRRLVATDVEVLPLGRRDVDLLAPDAATSLAHTIRAGDLVVFASARAPCRDIDMMVENMTMVRAVIAALVEVGPAHVVNISSDAVYGDEPVPITEANPAAPTTMHGAMHLAREIALAGIFGDRLAIVRPTLIYGAQDPHNGYGPNRFRRLAAGGEEIVLFGEGEEQRDHVLIDDVAELVAQILTRGSTGVLNIATGEVYSFRSIAESAVAKAGSSSIIRGTARSGPMPHKGYRPFDPSATRSAFPDFQYVSLPAGMSRVAAETAKEDQRG